MDGLWEGCGGSSVIWAGMDGPSEVTTPALYCGFCPGSVILQDPIQHRSQTLMASFPQAIWYRSHLINTDALTFGTSASF